VPTTPACRYVAIGASGGDGLDDINALLRALPRPLAAVVMMVLHRPVDRISQLREVLATATQAPVIVAREGVTFEPGRIYIGEPAHHLTLIGGNVASLVAGAENEHRNRTVDLLFRSLAEHAGASAIGIVLSGSLDDGARGLAAIHDAKGMTMVLTPDRQGHPGMPENAIDYDGPVDVVGSPRIIARELTRLVGIMPEPA
jgi:two-component system, chemotaxis family, protein-glutamate methylesterase/glutaminase